MTVYAALDDRLLSVRDLRGTPTSEERLVGNGLECVAGTQERPERVFAGTVESGLLRSEDGGNTWQEVGSFGGRVTAVTISPHDSEVVWAGTEPSAVYRSEDGGETWVHCEGVQDLPSADEWAFPPRPHTHHVRWLSEDPHDEGRLFVAIEAGAFVRTTDGGETWEPRPEGARLDNHTLSTHPGAPGRVYSAAGDGYAVSDDRGETWRYPVEGLDHRYVWGLAVDPEDPDTVVVSAATGARAAHTPKRAQSYVYRRANGSWERAMDGLPEPGGLARAVLDSGSRSGEFLALTNRGLYLSEDAADSWRDVPIEWPESYESKVGRGLVTV